MKNIQITARFQIHKGKVEEFKKIADQCNTIVKSKDKETIQYDWFFSPGQSECVVRETYTNSNAAMAHMENLGDLLDKLLALSDFYPEIYGDLSEELKNAAAPLNPKIYSFYQGL